MLIIQLFKQTIHFVDLQNKLKIKGTPASLLFLRTVYPVLPWKPTLLADDVGIGQKLVLPGEKTPSINETITT